MENPALKQQYEILLINVLP